MDMVRTHLPYPDTSFTDLGGNYSFPTHIVATDLRPNIVWWNDKEKTLVLVELTIPFDAVMDSASERKQAKYDHLLTTAKRNGFRASLVTLEIGSRGMPHSPGITALQEALNMSVSTLRKSKEIHRTNLQCCLLLGGFGIFYCSFCALVWA